MNMFLLVRFTATPFFSGTLVDYIPVITATIATIGSVFVVSLPFVFNRKPREVQDNDDISGGDLDRHERKLLTREIERLRKLTSDANAENLRLHRQIQTILGKLRVQRRWAETVWEQHGSELDVPPPHLKENE